MRTERACNKQITCCKYFNTTLVFNEDVYKDVEHMFKSRGREVTELNRKQAEVPANCIPIRNKNGTAPGMWVPLSVSPQGEMAKVLISMPGVPYEMKAMMENDVLPKLKQQFKLPAIFHKTILTQGIGESFLSELIADWEDGLAKHNIKLAYLPSASKVRLRLSAYGPDKAALEKLVEQQIESVRPTKMATRALIAGPLSVAEQVQRPEHWLRMPTWAFE